MVAKKTRSLEELEADLEEARATVRAAERERAAVFRKYEDAISKQFEESDEMDVAALVEHSHWNKAAYNKMNEYVKSLGLIGYEYWGDDTKDYRGVSPRFALNRDESVTATIKAIAKFCKKFEGFCEDDGGEVFIDFMENTLSEFGSYSVYWRPIDDSARLVKLTYGHPEDLFKGSLREVLKYVAKHHWYGEPYSEQEESGW